MNAKPFTSMKNTNLQGFNMNNTYANPDVWDSLIAKFAKTLIVENISLTEAQAVAEPLSGLQIMRKL